MSAGNRTSAALARKLENQAKALELRRMGKGYQEIARLIGCGKTQAHRYVVAGLEGARAQIAGHSDELRAEELSRLDALLEAVWPRARKGEVAAIDRALKIGERRAKLLGLDAPTKVAETDPAGNPVGPRRIELVAPGHDDGTADPSA